MGPRILYELSQEVSILIESGLRDEGDQRIPVFFCHPLDSLEDQPDAAEGTFGILYMTRITPETNLRQSGLEVTSGATDGPKQRLRRPPLWVRVRYVFLVAGGDVEQQLVALASVLQTLHDHPCVRMRPPRDESDGEEEDGGEELGKESGASDAVYPLRLVEDGEGWRELGLPEHRLALAFEVTCPIPASQVETVDRIQERGLEFEESAS